MSGVLEIRIIKESGFGKVFKSAQRDTQTDGQQKSEHLVHFLTKMIGSEG